MKKIKIERKYKNESRIIDLCTFEDYEKALEKMQGYDLISEENNVVALQEMIDFFYKYRKYRCYNCGKMMRRAVEGTEQESKKLYQCYACKTIRWIE